MPHRRRILLRGAVACLVPALLVISACAPDGGSNSPDTMTASPAPAPAALDPAAALDADFQRARSALNAEASALAKLERSSEEYARRYQLFLRDAAAAESLRARRDSTRRSAMPATSGPAGTR